MNIIASTRSTREHALRARFFLAATATLIAACSPPAEPADSGQDALVADRRAPGDAIAPTDATLDDSAPDTSSLEDASPDEGDASELDAVESDGSAMDATSTDASAMDSGVVSDARGSDAIADSAPDAIADSGRDVMADSAPDVVFDSGPDVRCPGAQQLCGGRCVDTQTDLMNCGACATVCPPPPSGTAACLAGRCGATPGSQTTLPAGSAAPITLGQPSLAVTMVVATTGVYPSRDSLGSGSAIGMVHLFAGDFGPAGAPIASGQNVSISMNTALFSLLGTTYGGDGRVTFALPDLRERLLVGVGPGAGLPDAPLGVVFGSATATLTLGSMPTHTHLLPDGTTRTTSAGRSEPFDHRAPSLPITAWVATEGVFPSPSGASMPFIGQIRWFGGNFTPNSGWAPADGRLLSISEYTALFSVIGTTYGGNGTTTFALPDLRGRAPLGTGTAPGGMTVALGKRVGTPQTTLTATQLPAHQHTLAAGGTTQSTGMGAPVSVVQPSLGVTWLIATQGIYPSRTGSGSFDGSDPYMGELIAFAGNFAPRGYARAEGQILPISTNTALFSILGTTFGGDGRANFGLPDLRARAPMGTSPTVALGTTRGAPTRTLVTANLPVHTHMH